MLYLFLTAPAETAGNAGTTASMGMGAMLEMILPIVLIFVVFYFFFIRPEKKRKKEVETMRNSLKVGDKVTTIGGIIGTVTYVNNDEDIVAIKSGMNDTELRFARWAIGTRAPVEEPAEETAAENSEEK